VSGDDFPRPRAPEVIDARGRLSGAAPAGEVRAEEVALPAVLRPATVAVPEAAGAVAKARAVWEGVQPVAESLVEFAEGYDALPGGSERKAFVARTLGAMLRDLADRHRILPRPLRAAALWALERYLPRLVEQVFQRLDRSGRVNAGRR
jgi:hypothetical protein